MEGYFQRVVTKRTKEKRDQKKLIQPRSLFFSFSAKKNRRTA
jgi:hypothetical protein